MKDVLKEAQLDRDLELSKYCGRSVEELEKLILGSKKSIQISTDKDLELSSYDHLYKTYKHLDDIDYIRTLAYYTVTRRAKYITSVEPHLPKNKKLNILDFGCGVGSHGIHFLQKGNSVDFLDVDGPLFNYAKFRIQNRGFKDFGIYHSEDKLPINKYDLVICLDVLEHVAQPTKKLKEINASLKIGGILLLEVSTMVKPSSGHFSKAIENWKLEGTKYLAASFKKISATVFIKK